MAQRAEVVLSDEDREVLERWARRPKSSQALALRCRIVLAAADGEPSKDIAARLGCSDDTVGRWRGRFATRGLDGLHDEPRPGKPRSISDEDVERVIVKTLEQQPANATHWSTRSMAAATGMSQSAVSRIWRAFGLKPHQVETFKLSPDPQFIDKVRDIVGLYLNPPEAAVVLCVDEKSQIQALDRSAPVLPLMPGVPARQTHDYLRHGTTNLYAALDLASGQVLAEMTPRHRAEEFRRFLNLIDASVPAHLDVHVVLDNSSTHKTLASGLLNTSQRIGGAIGTAIASTVVASHYSTHTATPSSRSPTASASSTSTSSQAMRKRNSSRNCPRFARSRKTSPSAAKSCRPSASSSRSAPTAGSTTDTARK